MIDRETALQITVSVGAVLVFVVVATYASGTYGADNHLTETGGLVLVGAVGVFVLLMTVAGLWLSSQNFDEESDVSEESDGDTA